MLTICTRGLLAAGSMLLFAAALPLHGENGVGAASPPPDAGLYTTYELGSSNTVIWGVCGSVFGGDGCVRGGSLGPFGKVGAMMETSAFFDMSTDTVTRWIYVVDIGSGSAHNGVRLYVYKKTDAFAGGKYVPSVTSAMRTVEFVKMQPDCKKTRVPAWVEHGAEPTCPTGGPPPCTPR